MPRVLRIHVRAPVRPTELPERVREAILNLFPEAKLDAGRDAIEGEAPNLDRLAQLVRQYQIPDTARGILLRGRRGATTQTTFLLGKQAAAAGAPNLGVQPGPLGEIEVTVQAETDRELLYAIYSVGFDTTVPEEWSRVPREYRPAEADAPGPEIDEEHP